MKTPGPGERSVRRRVVEAALAMNRSGINHGISGNVSARLPGPGTFAVTPTAVPYEELLPGSLSRLSLEGEWLDGEAPSTEWRLHRALYASRPEIGGIVHAHPLHASAIACLRIEIPAFHYGVLQLGGASVRCAPYRTFGTQELAAAVVEALRDRKACLMANHGIIAVGETVEEALKWAQHLELLSAMYLAALSAGSPVILSAGEIAEGIERLRSYGRPAPAAGACAKGPASAPAQPVGASIRE